MNLWAVLAIALTGLAAFVMRWIQAGQDRTAGAALQAGAAAVTAAKVETAIAQAEADAPTSKAALVDRLKAGTF